MAKVFDSQRRYRVAVHSNDHRPPHVHALGAAMDARFALNCPNGPVALMDFLGDWRRAHLNGLGGEIAARLDDCCRAWRKIHG